MLNIGHIVGNQLKNSETESSCESLTAHLNATTCRFAICQSHERRAVNQDRTALSNLRPHLKIP